MQHLHSSLRTRAIGVGHLRAFLAVARHLSFRAAADELALNQSAVSRQIQALEAEVGVPLFLRHTRAVELTGAGTHLLRAVAPSLERIDNTVRQIRHSAGRKIVSVSTWASFASMWLIPRLESFQHEFPDIDIRMDASDVPVDLETSDVDLVVRYALPGNVPAPALRLFGEQLTPVASPWLLQSAPPVRTGADLRQFALIEVGDAFRSQHMEWLTWQRWLDTQGLKDIEPKRWLYFNYAHQIAQAALSGQGVALARIPLVADSMATGALREVLSGTRLESPLAYWLIVGPRSGQRPEIRAFCNWLLRHAQTTRETLGETAPLQPLF
jgi:DNA-binding transcriptional LysR family regulator